MKTKIIASFFALGWLSACGGKYAAAPGKSVDPVQIGEDVGGVVKGAAYIPVTVAHGMVSANSAANYPVTIINPAHVRFSVDTSQMSIPAASNSLLDLGKILISDLFDNDISVCGVTGNVKCTKAYIRMYTTGVNGAGVWNNSLGWGAPIYAHMTGNPSLHVGLEAANAAIVQQIALTNRNVLRLQDFPNPSYEVRTDFTDAGAGSYSTTLVIEYGLLD